jgi:hypothetical protein
MIKKIFLNILFAVIFLFFLIYQQRESTGNNSGNYLKKYILKKSIKQEYRIIKIN